MLILRQSTAIDIRMGPFVDSTDGVTPETGITLAAADQAEVLKENGAATAAMAGAFVAVTGCDGWYDYTASTTDTNTVGEIVFVVQDASVCLPVFVRGFVVEEAVYDAMYEASAAGPLQSTVAGRKLDVTATGAAGIDWANIENATTAVDLSATDIQLCDTVTTNTDMRGTDNAALASVLGALTDAAAAGDPTSVDTVMQYIKQLINILIGTTGITTFPAEAAPANNVSLAEVIRAIHADVTGINGAAMRGTDSAALASVCTEARLAELDAGNLPTDVANVQSDTNDIQTRLPAALIGGRMDSDVEAINNNTGAADTLALHLAGVITGSTTGTPTTTSSNTDLTGFADDELIGRVIIFTGGTANGQASDITDYASVSGVVTYTALTTAPAASDTFVIV